MLLDTIKNDYNNALKSHESVKVNVLRMLVSDIKNKEIELRGSGLQLTDTDMVNVLQKSLKTRNESAEIFQKAGRIDLYDAEIAEIAVISEYLPKQMTDDEIDAVVKELMATIAVKDFGTIMRELMVQLKGKADGKKVGEAVKRNLG